MRSLAGSMAAYLTSVVEGKPARALVSNALGSCTLAQATRGAHIAAIVRVATTVRRSRIESVLTMSRDRGSGPLAIAATYPLLHFAYASIMGLPAQILDLGFEWLVLAPKLGCGVAVFLHNHSSGATFRSRLFDECFS